MNDLLYYTLDPGKVEAFSTYRDSELPYHVVTGHQVHGAEIAVVTDPETDRGELDGYDALITNVRGCAIGVRTADCIPVLLYDVVNEVVAAIHSGWKGTLKRIAQKTVQKMTEVYGAEPENIKAVIGPGICRKCFQVGEEVVRLFEDEGFDLSRIHSWDGPKQEGSMAGGHHIDLIETNRLILVESGIKSENILISGICTYEDTRFFSARREGTRCGRIINSIKL